MTDTLPCKACAKQFVPRVDGAGYKYCSPRCREEGRKEWHKHNKDARKRYYLEYRYKLKPKELPALLAKQGGKCAVCGKPLDVGGGHRGQPGKPKGLLCTKCNRGLALFNDNPKIIKRALRYARADSPK